MRGAIPVRTRGEREPLRGLPGPLPEGEEILWQGAPAWMSLARRAFHLRALTAYVLLLGVWYAVSRSLSGHPAEAAALAGLWVAVAGGAALGFLALFAWLTSWVTTYTITTRRVVMQVGIAMTFTVNIPFSIIGSASLRRNADGTGDIPLSLVGEQRALYAVLWPHARPRRFMKPEPMLRAIPDAIRVADLLARALAAAPAEQPVEPALTDLTPQTAGQADASQAGSWQPASAAA